MMPIVSAATSTTATVMDPRQTVVGRILAIAATHPIAEVFTLDLFSVTHNLCMASWWPIASEYHHLY